MLNLKEIIEKLKDIVSKELENKKIFDKDIANVLQIKYQNFRKQKSLNSIPYIEIMSFLAKRKISINWFFFNQLPESLIEETSNYIILQYQRNITASAGGGAVNYELNPSPLIIDKQVLDHLNSSYKYTQIIKVLGDSMEPQIKDNSLVFVDKSNKKINRSGVFIISTDEGLFLKKIKVHNNKYVMYSINKQYQDIQLTDFTVVGKVTGILSQI